MSSVWSVCLRAHVGAHLLLHRVCLNAWLCISAFNEALLLRVCLSGQSFVVRICCTVFFWMPNCLNMSLLLMRHFFCLSVCQVNLLWCLFAAPCFLNAKLPESVSPPIEALLLRVCLSGQSSVVRICCTVFSECQMHFFWLICKFSFQFLQSQFKSRLYKFARLAIKNLIDWVWVSRIPKVWKQSILTILLWIMYSVLEKSDNKIC